MATESKQAKIFLNGEGDAWYRRNQASLRVGAHGRDPVLAAIEAIMAQPGKVLEIGCSDGYRLEALRREYDAECYGIDPSAEAVSAGRKAFPLLNLEQAGAHTLPYDDGIFDLIIFGFCLYLCDREDLFRIAAEADRVLGDRGIVAVYDFLPPAPYRNVYTHHQGLYSYKMDYARMLLWNPAYQKIYQNTFAVQGCSEDDPDARLAVTLVRKDFAGAWPEIGASPEKLET